MPFVKGQSGNPAGRKRTSPTLANELRKLLGRRPSGDGTPSTREQVAQAAITGALSGDAACLKLVFERVDGKLPQPLEHSGPGGGPVRLQWAEVEGDDA